MINEKGPDEVALAAVFLHQLGALHLRILDQALNEVCAALADHRSDCAIVLHSSAHNQRSFAGCCLVSTMLAHMTGYATRVVVHADAAQHLMEPQYMAVGAPR